MIRRVPLALFVLTILFVGIAPSPSEALIGRHHLSCASTYGSWAVYPSKSQNYDIPFRACGKVWYMSEAARFRIEANGGCASGRLSKSGGGLICRW